MRKLVQRSIFKRAKRQWKRKVSRLRTVHTRKVVMSQYAKDTAFAEIESDLSIVVCTYSDRLMVHALPLVRSLVESNLNAQIFVIINGDFARPFQPKLRRDFLQAITRYEGVNPISFGVFRSVSVMWNTGIRLSGSERVLILNDDVLINVRDFRKEIELALKDISSIGLLTINETWSHFLISREVIRKVGWFDEKYLGIGEEDGDYFWRYEEVYGHQPRDMRLSSLINNSEDSSDPNLERGVGKYSLQNSTYTTLKYKPNNSGHAGMFGFGVNRVQPEQNPYPIETFIWDTQELLRLSDSSEVRVKMLEALFSENLD